MTAKVLGRVTSPDRPRGPDVHLTLSIPRDWLAGATLEFELPRNLACAACGGGGCDTCGRSGAVTLRGRKDPIEVVEVTLPKNATESADATAAHALYLRIPQRGGHAPAESDLPRGNLLLSITTAEEPSKGVKRLPRPSLPAPAPPEILDIDPSVPPGAHASRKRAVGVVVAIAIVILLVLWRLARK
jgi:hypothetical protein